jgi:hypothetical protein
MVMDLRDRRIALLLFFLFCFRHRHQTTFGAREHQNDRYTFYIRGSGKRETPDVLNLQN